MHENLSINELEKIINRAQDRYYQSEDAEMSDAEFDGYWNELAKRDPDNPILHRVGSDLGNSIYEKVNHMIPMGSQNKANEAYEFIDWARKYPGDYIVEYKCDGSSIELQYKNGVFEKAVTRGNGYIGDDVTDNIKQVKNIPFTLKDKGFTGAVRGEVLLMHDVFNEHFKDKANCRNAANGIMKRKNSIDAKYLSIIAYDVGSLNRIFKLEIDKLIWLKDNGFEIVYAERYPYKSDGSQIDRIIKFRDELSSSRFTTIQYDIDGIVVKSAEVDMDDLKKDRPDKQIAFKFILNEQPSKVRAIEWYVNGKTRTPVAVCDPVYLCGTTVQRANLCNLGLISKLNLKIGSTVMMVKRGEIIPKIERVLNTPPDAKPIEFPKVCNCCGSNLVITDTQIYCPNPECENTIIHHILKWCKVNKIYNIGDTIAANLVRSGIVKSIYDLYKTKEISFSMVMPPKIAKKVYNQIKTKKEMYLTKFIAGYDMDGIGEKTVREIVDAVKPNTLEEFLSIKPEDLIYHTGFAELSAESICEQFAMNKAELLELATIINVKMPKPFIDVNAGVSHVSGLNIVITGELEHMSRDKAKEMLEDLGAKLQSKVTSTTDYLVCNSKYSSSSKYRDAVKLGKNIINEHELLTLMQGTF